MSRTARHLVAFAFLALTACASASKEEELENVAKDWCLTIRASQVLPVYPLSEDVRPGDVFVVPTTLREQARIYEERGFLPLDQRVTRFHGLDFDGYYRSDGIARGLDPVLEQPASSAGVVRGVGVVQSLAPRAAFPSYSFSVDASSGLKLALPIQGVPVGLGVMGARRASGTVTIRDAYTYGIHSEAVLEELHEWWEKNPEVRQTLSDVVRQVNEPIFLRIVTRVYFTGGVTVSLNNLATSGAGLDAGVRPELELVELATTSPSSVEAALAARAKVLAALSNDLSAAAAGGSFRFTQASARSVSLDEDFDQPLVIGYRGFDVKVFGDGSLSAPIPSFATLRGDESIRELDRGSYFVRDYGRDENTEVLDDWLDADDKNYDVLRGWLQRESPLKASAEGAAGLRPSDLLYGKDQGELREKAVEQLLGDSSPEEN